MVIYCGILLRTINVSDKIVKKIRTQILFSIICFFLNHTFYEIMWKNYKGVENNTNFGQITGIQEKLDTIKHVNRMP
jgi:hypothetical protein